MTRFKTILCPTDFSKHAARALEVAIELARPFASSLWIVHVVEPPFVFGAELGSPGLAAELLKVQHATATAELARVIEQCRAAGMTARSQLEVGSPALTIVGLTSQADLVVMGTRGRTGVEHFLIGSVAEKVVRSAKCPVLVVGEPGNTSSSNATETQATRG